MTNFIINIISIKEHENFVFQGKNVPMKLPDFNEFRKNGSFLVRTYTYPDDPRKEYLTLSYTPRRKVLGFAGPDSPPPLPNNQAQRHEPSIRR